MPYHEGRNGHWERERGRNDRGVKTAQVRRDSEFLAKMKMKSKFFKGLADPTRLYIFEVLREGEKSVGEIATATGYSQSSVSNHLACLREIGLVANRQEGKNVYYAIRDAEVTQIIDMAEDFLRKYSQERLRCILY